MRLAGYVIQNVDTELISIIAKHELLLHNSTYQCENKQMDLLIKPHNDVTNNHNV